MLATRWPTNAAPTFESHFATWDAAHYLLLATQGYAEGIRPCAFYALGPLLWRVIIALGAAPIWGGLPLLRYFENNRSKTDADQLMWYSLNNYPPGPRAYDGCMPNAEPSADLESSQVRRFEQWDARGIHSSASCHEVPNRLTDQPRRTRRPDCSQAQCSAPHRAVVARPRDKAGHWSGVGHRTRPWTEAGLRNGADRSTRRIDTRGQAPGVNPLEYPCDGQGPASQQELGPSNLGRPSAQAAPGGVPATNLKNVSLMYYTRDRHLKTPAKAHNLNSA